MDKDIEKPLSNYGHRVREVQAMSIKRAACKIDNPKPIGPENEITHSYPNLIKAWLLSKEAFKDLKRQVFNFPVKEYSYYDKLIHAGLGEEQAADIYALCDKVKASNNVKDVLAQSIMCGRVDTDAFRVMYVECLEMFDKHKEVEMIEAIHMTKFKPIRIDYFLRLLDI